MQLKGIHIDRLLSLVLFVAFLLSFLATGCNTAPLQSNNNATKLPSYGPKEYEEVSIINLITTPERFHGKRVRITGYLDLQYENDAVYLHKEDYDMDISKNRIGLIITTETRNSTHYQDCNHKYVFVEGTFNMHAGNMGSFNSSLDSIARLEVKRVNIGAKLGGRKQR